MGDRSNKIDTDKTKKTIKVLNENYNPLEIIIDNQPFSCWLKDEAGNYLAVNKAFAEYSGASKRQIIGKNDFDLYSQEEATIYVTSDKAILSGETKQFYESVVNGFWKEEFKKIAYDNTGNVIGVTGFARDITNRKIVEEALAESEKSMAILLSNLPGVAYRCKNDKAWTMTFLSEGCHELTGYKPEELIGNKGRSYYQLIAPEDREKTFLNWEKDVAANSRSNDEYRIITKSGEVKWVWEQSIPVEDKKGELTYSEGFILDITNIKQAERALRESEDRFRTIFEEAPLGIGIFDTKTGFVYQLNNKFCEILGRTPQELQSMDWKSYSHPDEIQENINKLKLLKKEKINDSFGHAAGDTLLKEIARILKSACRGEDFVARIGGDEFVILLNQTDVTGAEKVCSRIYKFCKDYGKSHEKKTFYLSISLGFATKLAQNQNVEELLKEAEDMLYKRKNLDKKKIRKTIMEAVKSELAAKSGKPKERIDYLMKISNELGEKLKLSPNKLKELELLMEIHDIGKLTLNDEILLKESSKTSKESSKMSMTELFEYQKHPETGYRIALGAPELKNIAEEIISHHEHWDGSGYPKGTRGERIPFLSRIILVVDTYDQLTKGGMLKNKKEQEKVLELMSTYSGTYFDPHIIKTFLDIVKSND